jgi:transcriptional regulator GlxA family with amidase domain
MRMGSKPKRRLLEVYKHAGFRPRATIREAEGDAGTLIVSLERRSKKRCAAVAVRRERAGTTAGSGKSATWAAADTGLFWNCKCAVWTAVAAAG